jgi:hypothetical protein
MSLMPYKKLRFVAYLYLVKVSLLTGFDVYP